MSFPKYENVWRGVSTDDAHKDPKGKVLPGRFIMSNKGDLQNPKIRCRDAARETNIFSLLPEVASRRTCPRKHGCSFPLPQHENDRWARCHRP